MKVGKPDDRGETGPEAAIFAKTRERVPKPLPKDKPPAQVTVTGDKL